MEIKDSVQEKTFTNRASKGKFSSKAWETLEELKHLTYFNQNINFAHGKALQHLSDFTFVQMANLTLVRRYSGMFETGGQARLYLCS